ncbi:MAG: hypothetical protein R6U96_02230 [Promethearchaeia archaeon]
MESVEVEKKKILDARRNFENVKRAIKGIYEILSINLSEENMYYKMSIDNIIGLYQNLLELLTNEQGMKDLRERIKNSEIDIDIPMDIFI